MLIETVANVLYLNHSYVQYYIFHTVYVYLYISLDINHVRVLMYDNFFKVHMLKTMIKMLNLIVQKCSSV